ncbi:MAG: type II toxin-antitoxin system RelE/ParE family toxin [Candidatus Binatia bacterium]
MTFVRHFANNTEPTMSTIEVLFYQEADGTVPLLQWFKGLQAKALEKCLARLLRLEELGHELRRPEGDYLRDGMYELRASLEGMHYRMLYFFHGKLAAVVSHGIVKERTILPKEIDRAVARKKRFAADPKRHTFRPGGLRQWRPKER